MKKFKIGISFLFLVLICVITQKFLLLINYIFALILHELAHLFMAVKKGYSLKIFKLSLFGVAVELNEKIDDKDSFCINVSGPIFNLFLCIVCVALYWLVPKSFEILSSFCIANLTLAVFNLLPIYPLDGGKIFASMVSSKTYKITEKFIRYAISISLILIFIFTLNKDPNWFLILFAVFFLLTNNNHENKMKIFKYSHNKKIEKVVLLKVTGEESLFELLKKIQTRKYTIFYINKISPKYIDEDQIIDISTQFPLVTKLNEIINYFAWHALLFLLS